MKVTRLRLAELKQFHQPLEIDDLDDDINLFVGPNESGKSTLVDAIRSAFFERHKSSRVAYLQPWGDSSAAPEIEIEFLWQGTPWKLSKRFLKKKRCDLQIGENHHSGDEAEDKLAELLGFELAKRGVSKPEHHGIPGLLWVSQGAVQDIRDPVNHAGEHLQAALNRGLGDITSSSGDDLIALVEEQRSQLLTRTGQPTAEYRQTIQQCEQNRASLAELQEKVAQYRQQVDELGRLRQQQRETDSARPWLAQRERAREAEARLAEVRGWQQQQQADEQSLTGSEESRKLVQQQLKDFQDTACQLQERAGEQRQAESILHECRAHTPALKRQLAAAESAYRQARDGARRARRQAVRRRLQTDLEQLVSALAVQQKTLDTARALQEEVEQLRAQQQTVAIDARGLQRLRVLHTRLGELQVQQQAIASRLVYELEPGKSVQIGNETLRGQGERLLLEPADITLPGVGTLRLQPGGTDSAELRREQEQREGERDGLLQQLGILTLDEGERRAADEQELSSRLAGLSSRLAGLAPEGVDPLDARYRRDDYRRRQLVEQLTECPPADPDCPDEHSADQALEAAQDKLATIEKAANVHQRELAVAEQALARATAEWQSLSARVQAPERRQREQAASTRLVDLNAEITHLQAALAERRQHIDAARPDMLADDIERHHRSADAMERAAIARGKAITELEVRLQTLGAQAVEEERDALQQETERLQRRRDQLRRRATALDLLLKLLRDKRQALTRRLQAPLQKHLNHYLGVLFPQAELAVDEHLIPATLTRDLEAGREHGAVQALSYGAREQMGLISRLAYADLLQEAGKPTLLILDDALVHSDRARLNQMKRVLYDAARRHQILLFSCHPDKWRDLGVAARELQALKGQSD